MADKLQHCTAANREEVEADAIAVDGLRLKSTGPWESCVGKLNHGGQTGSMLYFYLFWKRETCFFYTPPSLSFSPSHLPPTALLWFKIDLNELPFYLSFQFSFFLLHSTWFVTPLITRPCLFVLFPPHVYQLGDEHARRSCLSWCVCVWKQRDLEDGGGC